MRVAVSSLVFVLAFAFALVAPLAAAQVPAPPAPGDVVAAACGVANAAPVHVPVCPIADPPAPADPNAPHEHPGVPDAPPASPQDAQALAQDAAGQAQGAAQDPQSAPDRAAAVVATIVQFVKDLLHLPAVAGAHVHAAGVNVERAIAQAGAKAGALGAKASVVAGKISRAANDAIKTIGRLIHGQSAARDAAPDVHAPLYQEPPRNTVTNLVPGQVRDALPRGQ